jgi:dipeptidyl-peptidase-4
MHRGHNEPPVILDAMPPDVRSPRTGVPAGLLVRNESSRNLVVDWVDFDGDRRPQTRIAAGETQSIGARAGHAFVIEAADGPDAGKFVRVAFADFPTGEAVVRDSDFEQAVKYRTIEIEGWVVHLEKSLSDKDAGAIKTSLTEKLSQLKTLVPERHHAALQQVPFWFDKNAGEDRGQYHSGFYWMAGSGWHLKKRMAIHFCTPRSLLEFEKWQPMVILHELTHAYHHQVLGFDDKRIIKAFENARDAGLYDKVKHVGGKTMRAYAMDNEREYFAELTEAYFGTNDYFPFNREELRLHDPVGYRMVENAWNVPK